MTSREKNRISVRILLAAAMVALLLSCLALVIFAEDAITWNTLTDGGTLSSGYYRLEEDITLTKIININNGSKVTIDLNGYMLKGPGTGAVINNGGSVTIQDSNPKNGPRYFKIVENGPWEYASTVTEPTNGYHAVYGGIITGGRDQTGHNAGSGGGGAVKMGSYEGDKLIMEGGTFVGNSSTRAGGAIYGGETHMHGGAIIGNYGYLWGGGISVSGKYFMSGGEVWGNSTNPNSSYNSKTAEQSKYYDNAQIIVGYRSTFEMSGGTITGNMSTVHNSTNAAAFEISGGTLNGNFRILNPVKAKISGGTVNGSIYMLDGSCDISGNAVIQNGKAINGKGAYEGGGALYLKGGTVTMSGGTIQNCSTEKLGGAIYVTGGSVEMSGGTIQNCSAATGGGIYVNGGNFSMSGGVLQNNVATANGGGVYVNGGNFSISGGTIGAQDAPNQAQNGGGAYVNGGNVNITGGNLQYNAASSLGGGIYLTGGEFTLNGDSASINNNSATSGGGVYLLANPILLAGSITANTASENGGGICIDQAEVALAPTGRVNISQNQARNGAGIYIGGTAGNLAGFSVASDCIGEVVLNDNIATANGGGACLSYGNFNIDSDKILLYGNRAANGGGVAVLNGSFALSAGAVGVIEEVANFATNGGGVYVNGGDVTVTGGNIESNTAINGGGVYLTGGEFTLNGESASINDNTATNGGGVYLTQISPTLLVGSITKNTATANGGGIFIEQKIVELKPTGAVLITDNSAQNGAGLYINGTTENDDAGFSVDDSDGGTVTLTGNTASANGGGVYVNNGFFTMDTDHLILQKNGAVDGGAVYVNGGNATLSNGTVDQNTASRDGGGIYVDGGSFQMSSGSVANNKASNNGAGIYVNGGEVVLRDGSIIGNEATQNGGGIAVANGNVTMLGGRVDNNRAVNGSGGGIYVTTTDDTEVLIQSGSISYNQNNIYGGALAVYGGSGGTIKVTIGLNENHYDENGTLVGCDHYENGSTNLDCPVIKDNTVANEGGAIYIKGGSTTVLGIYCIIESGNRAGGISAGDEEETTLSDFMMVEGGTVEISSADSQAGGSTYGYGHGVIEGSIHVKAGKVDLWGSMLNPFIEAPITVDIEGKNDYFKDHRQNEEGKIKWYKIHYYENFEKNGVTTGRYTAFAVNSEEKHLIRPALYTHEGYSIVAWNTKEKPTVEVPGYEYAVGLELSFHDVSLIEGFNHETGTLVLYAVWSDNTYKIVFLPNAPSYEGTMATQTLPCTSSTELDQNEYSREFYVFLGWGKNAGQIVPTYFNGETIQPLTTTDGEEIKLYAIWGVCNHSNMEITSEGGKTTTHTPTLTYSADGAMLTVTCSCQYCESATLHAENAIYDGNPHTASVTYSHGVLLKDLLIVYDYALPEGVTLEGPEASNHNGNRYAGTYTAQITAGEQTASLTYVVARAPQKAPETPTYSVSEEGTGDSITTTITITEVTPSSVDGILTQYRFVYNTNVTTDWSEKNSLDLTVALTNYYVEVRYQGNRNYLDSNAARSSGAYFFTGDVTFVVEIVDEGIQYTVDKASGSTETTDGIRLTLDHDETTYYLYGADGKYVVSYTIDSGSLTYAYDNHVCSFTSIPSSCKITVQISGTKRIATANTKLNAGEVFSTISANAETAIARDSAFTVNFRVEDYANYSGLKIAFDKALPAGTTVILKNMADGTYWWAKLTAARTEILLTSFKQMGTDTTLDDPTATTLHYQFIVDFSDVATTNLLQDSLKVSLTATSSNKAPTLNPSASVTLKEITFSLTKDTEDTDAQETVNVIYAQTEGVASKWNGLTGYLILTPKGEGTIPPDLVLRVTSGNATSLYQRKAGGFFAVKLTGTTANLVFALESEMFPTEEATYQFDVAFYATAVGDAPRGVVMTGKTAELTFVIPLAETKSMARLSGDRRIYRSGGTLELQMSLELASGDEYSLQLLYKNENNTYSNTLIPVTVTADGKTITANLTELEFGSYCVLLKVSNAGTTVLTVPYYFIIE